MIEITAALTAARSLLQLASDALNARDDAKVRMALSELQSKLFDATSAALAMAEKASSLQSALSESEREKREVKATLEERGSYELHELEPGSFAYASKASAERPGVPQHYLCQPCYDKGIKAVLRFAPGGELMRNRWLCPEGGGVHTVHAS